MIESAILWLLHLLSAPEVGLSSVFLISFVSATLLPLGSEPAVFAAVKAAPGMFWPIVGIATLGNTLGGVLDYWLGLGARQALTNDAVAGAVADDETGVDKPDSPASPAGVSPRPAARKDFATERGSRWFGWLERYGAKTMLLAWVPGIGDPICTLGGWLRLPFWPSVGYMAIGKFLRYLMMTSLLMAVPDGFWRQVARLLG